MGHITLKIIFALALCVSLVIEGAVIAVSNGIYADARDEPGEMNQEPGNYMNIFPTLTSPIDGYVTSVKIYSFAPGDVMVSFWNNTHDDVFALVNMVPISADGTGLETFTPEDDVFIYAGNALGVYHTDSDSGGVIYYENAQRSPRTDDVDVYPVYDLDEQGIFSIGDEFDFEGRYKDEDSGKTVAIHVEISALDEDVTGSTEEVTPYTEATESALICEFLEADDREEPGEMNKAPGNWFNLFPSLTVPLSGHVTSISFYAARAGDVVVSFWWHTGEDGEFTMVAAVPITSTGPGLQTIVPEEHPYVEAGAMLGIHYLDEDADGVIYYEFYNGETSFGVPLYEFYMDDMQGDWDVGHVLDLSESRHTTDTSLGRNVAVQVEICAEPSDDETTYHFEETTYHDDLTTEDPGLVCDVLAPDSRYRPDLMNREPGNYFNLFPTLTIPQAGFITKIQYYAANAGDVVVSFWHEFDVAEFELSTYVVVTSEGSGFQEFRPDETVYVEEGDILGIFYLDEDDPGVIYYEFETEDSRTDDVPVYEVYAKRLRGRMETGDSVEFEDGDYHGEGDGRNIALQVYVCDEESEATTSDYGLICGSLDADPRDEVGEMNRQPGNWFNLFPTLAAPQSGHITEITFYAANAGEVCVSFWRQTDRLEYTLHAFVELTSVGEGLQEYHPEEYIEVEEGDVLGISYLTDDDPGVIYYEFASDERTDDVELVYPVFYKDIQGFWSPGKVVTFTGEGDYRDEDDGRNIAIQVEICAEETESTTEEYGVCEEFHPDGLSEPDELNLEPGNWMNMFVSLTIPASGYVSDVTYYAATDGDVVVSFWNQSSAGVFILDGQIQIPAEEGLHTYFLTDESVHVEKWEIVAIHYLDEDDPGVIYLEDSGRDRSSQFDLHTTLSSQTYGSFEIGHEIDITDAWDRVKSRSPALHLTICGIEEGEEPTEEPSEEEEEEEIDETLHCGILFADNRTELSELNQAPGTFMNIFPEMRVPRGGQIHNIEYYAAAIGQVVVGFWQVIDEDGIFELAAQVVIDVNATGAGTFEPVEHIFVHEDCVVGVHYLDEDDDGIIYYENAREEDGTENVTVGAVFYKGIYGNLSIGHVVNLTGEFRDEDEGKTIALHLQICAPECGFNENGTYADSCLREWWYEAGCHSNGYSSPDVNDEMKDQWNGLTVAQVKENMQEFFESAAEGNDLFPKLCFGNDLCEHIKGDNRTRPQELNSDPGRWLNIFPSLTAPISGAVSSVRFYAAHDGEVVISFWNETSEGVFTLAASFPINASEGYQAYYPEESILVKEGYALGIYYTEDGDEGVIYYEDGRSDDDSSPVPLHPVYCADLQSDYPIGKVLDLSEGEIEEGKNVAIHVEICAMCETVTPDNRTVPGEMNLAPGRWLNLFPSITMPYLGRVNSIVYYAAFAGNFTVSFWSNTSESHHYVLESQVEIYAESSGLHTFKPMENVPVSGGNMFAIHYPDSEGEGVVYYETEKEDRLVEDIPIYDVYTGALYGEWEVGHELDLTDYQAEDRKNVAIHITVCEYDCDMYVNGPFDRECLEEWWEDTGCHEEGTASPNNNPSLISEWNTMDIEGVQADMQAYFDRATEDDYYSDTCWGNGTRPSAPENCTGVDCYCHAYNNTLETLGENVTYAYAPFGNIVTGFRVCSGEEELSGIVAGIDVYFSDGSTGSILGCEDRVNLYELVSLADDERIIETTVWYSNNILVINALKFVSNLNNTYGPYGTTNLTDGLSAYTVEEQSSALTGFVGISDASEIVEGFLNQVGFLWEDCPTIEL